MTPKAIGSHQNNFTFTPKPSSSSDAACRGGGETSQEATPTLHFCYNSTAGPEITNFRTPKSSEYFLIKAPTLGPGVSETEKDRTNPFHPAFAVFTLPNLTTNLSQDALSAPVFQVEICSRFLI